MRKIREIWTVRAGIASGLAIALGGFVALGGGCDGSNASAYCEARCDCKGCSQTQREDCLDDVDDAERLAAHDGCADEYAAYLKCYVQEGTCKQGGYLTPSCSALAQAFRSCSARAAKYIKTPCQDARAKREACGTWSGGVTSCAGTEECMAYCVIGSSCPDIVETWRESAFTECVNACFNGGGTGGGGVGGDDSPSESVSVSAGVGGAGAGS